MKLIKVALMSLIALGSLMTLTFAAGEIEKGKALFNDPNFAGGMKACSSCHPDGRGLERTGGKKEFHIMGGTQKSLEEAINFCIVNAIQGKAIDVNSAEMKEMVAYIKSLWTKKTTPGY